MALSTTPMLWTPHSGAAAELTAVAGNLRVTTHAADVASEVGMVSTFADIAVAHGQRVDVLVNSAGISGPKTFVECGAEEFEQTYRVNVVGTRNATHAALPYMTGAAGGRVVFVSSQAGQTGIYGYSAYSVREIPATTIRINNQRRG